MLYFLSELFEFSRKFPEIIMISGMTQYREINTSEIIFGFPAGILKFFVTFSHYLTLYDARVKRSKST